MPSTPLKELLDIPEYNQLSKPVRADLFEILYQYSEELNDHSTCYLGHAALQFGRKKMESAEKYYARANSGDSQTSLNRFVVLVDTTAFGKGDEGFYITEDRLFFRQKPFLQDEIKLDISLKSINSIYIDGEEITINQKTINYSGISEERMEIIVDCIRAYTNQFKHS